MSNCPNCNSLYRCNCTWEEMQQAARIIREREAKYRRKIGKPTVVEEERERRRKQLEAALEQTK
jgi:NADH:ubiquinone oxidoreductase subunit D